MIKIFKDLFKKVRAPIKIPKNFIIEGTVLPNFPKMNEVDNRSIYNIINKNKILMKISGEESPSCYIGEKFDLQYKIDTRFDSECYPTHSPIKIYISVKDEYGD